MRDKWHPDIWVTVQWDYNPERGTEIPTMRSDRDGVSDWKRERGRALKTKNWDPTYKLSSQFQLPPSTGNAQHVKLDKQASYCFFNPCVSPYSCGSCLYISLHINQEHDKRVMLPGAACLNLTTQSLDFLMKGRQNGIIVFYRSNVIGHFAVELILGNFQNRVLFLRRLLIGLCGFYEL